MSTRALPFILALLTCALGGATAAVAQTALQLPASGKSTPATVPATVPTSVVLTPIEFYLARGDANACGRGCNEWIAAEGKIDADAADRLRQLLKKLGERRPPIYFHSPGGNLNGSLALGRLIRDKKFTVSVGHTIPRDCGSDKQSANSCAAQKRSGTAIAAEISPVSVQCNSGCVYALAGGTVRLVPPGVKLGIHDAGLDPNSNLPRGATLAMAMRLFHVRIRTYLREMGMDDGLFSAALGTPFESVKLLERDDIVRFGIDRREFGETEWRFADGPAPKIMKPFFVHTDGDQPHYVDGVIEVGCSMGGGMFLILARQPLGSDTDSSGAGSPAATIAVNGKQVSLKRVASAKFYVRSGWVMMSTFYTVADGATIDLPGSELGRKELGNVTLTMEGFSAAYAKLQSRCAPATPMSVSRPLQKQGTLPDALAASPNSQVLWQQTLELARVAAAEQKLRLDFLYKILPGCSSAGQLKVRVLEQPQHGTLSIEKGQASTDFPEDDERAACNTRASDGTLVFYQSNADYRGADSITLYVVSPLGDAVTRHYAIDVK